MPNRSSSPSGRWKTPTKVTGFCVAITKNGCGRRCVTPSTVTEPSCIASNRLDWVRGEARLISSARMNWCMIAPCLNTNVRWSLSQTVMPVMSPGSRSGVNWMRAKSTPALAAMTRASVVLPTPGTSSISTCRPEMKPASMKRTSRFLPTKTRAMASSREWTRSAFDGTARNHAASAGTGQTKGNGRGRPRRPAARI